MSAISLVCTVHSAEQTYEMVNARRLALMKPSAILINTGRGQLINEQDLADALNNEKIYAAGLDVLSSEPPACRQSVAHCSQLLHYPPHCLGYNSSSRTTDDHLSGKPTSI